MDKTKNHVKISLDQLTEQIQSSEKLNNYTELDLRRWIKQLEELRILLEKPSSISIVEDEKPSSFIHTIKVIDNQSLLNSSLILEKSKSNSQKSTDSLEEHFFLIFGPCQLSEDDCVVTHSSYRAGLSQISDINHYSSGKHATDFLIERKGIKNIFIGIISSSHKIISPIFDYSIHGWWNLDHVIINGERKGDNGNETIETGDKITLIIDCDHQQIQIEHHRTKRLVQLPINLDVCPFPWKILVRLLAGGDSIRILHYNWNVHRYGGTEQILGEIWKKNQENVVLLLFMAYLEKNSFQVQIEVFIPTHGNEVRWYIGGPTFYETIDMNHVRHYMSLDILRRVMKNYFGYDVVYLMGISDIDYKNIHNENNSTKISSENIALPTDKKQPKTSIGGDILPSFSKNFSSRTRAELDTNYLLQHNRQFEMDMKTLNVLSPNLNIHSSDYLQEIQAFIKDIVAKGRSYESNSLWNSDSPIDIYTCGFDEKLAHCKNDSSIKYFLSIGDLVYDESSSNNIIKLQEVLDKNYSIENIRLLFLVNKWSSQFEFNMKQMQMVLNLEEKMNSILHDIEYYLNFIKEVNNDATKCAIHHAFCNSIDTPSVIEQIRELLSTTNNYMNTTSENVHRRLIQNIYNFIMHLFDILGLKYDLTFVDDMQSTRSIQQQT
ncbi:unnamed protein product [Rotaria sp. Silwood2]|nr:unnamed protein product [Rotaria sp. Silwood2]CAF4116324.1 unnamed protein product [Rotaria sp. Silwood2]